MDDLTLLRDLDADVAPPTPIVTIRARRRLLRAATAHHRRRTRVLTGLAASAVLAGGLVVGGTFVRHDGTVVASAQAAEVLHRAATATLATSDPVVAPGQYLRIDTHEMDLNGSDGAGHSLWLTDTTSTTWVPADRADTWVLRQSPRAFVRWIVRGAEDPAVQDGEPELLRAPRGEFYGPVGDSWETPTTQFLASLPRDPGALLARIRADGAGHGPTPDDEAFQLVADVLRSGIVPADLRAALFSAAQDIPGLTVTDAATNLDGHPGVAIGRTSDSGVVGEELLFDRGTGLFIGERSVADHGYPGVAPRTVVGSSALTTRVVDADQVP